MYKGKNSMNNRESYLRFISLLRQAPQALSVIRGSAAYPDLQGEVRFYQLQSGVLVVAEVMGLPVSEKPCGDRIFAFHIHDGSECSGNAQDPFADSGMHYNPQDCLHPYHAGDMPPLFGNDGTAFSAFVTNRFSVQEVVGKTVIIHDKPDDFTTQPSGNAGTKIACGKIL